MDKVDALMELLASQTDSQKLKDLFSDLCTDKEIENMAERLFAAKLLLEGKTYNQVMEQSNISSAPLSRVSRCVQYGKGYRNLLK